MRSHVPWVVLGLGLVAVTPAGSARLPENPHSDVRACPLATASAAPARRPAAGAPSAGGFSSSACCIAPNIETPGRTTLRIDDMIDEAAAQRVRRVLRTVPGVRRVDIRLKYASADIQFDETRTSVDRAITALETAGLAAYRSPACCELPPR